jgi:hypothetical protein
LALTIKSGEFALILSKENPRVFFAFFAGKRRNYSFFRKKKEVEGVAEGSRKIVQSLVNKIRLSLSFPLKTKGNEEERKREKTI